MGPGKFHLGLGLSRWLAATGAISGALLAVGLVAKMLTAKPEAVVGASGNHLHPDERAR